MQLFIESALYSASQFFMLPVLLAVIVMFIYAFFAVGQFLTQARQRRRGDPRGYDLLESWRLAASMNRPSFPRHSPSSGNSAFQTPLAIAA